MDPRLYRQLHEIERTHWWFAARRKILAAALARLGVRGQNILDVGCGAGTNLDLLGERYPDSSLHGIDIELAPLRFCREDRPLPVSQADLANLPFRDGSFDLVCAFDALEHVEDDAQALRGLFDACRPGGTLVATVPAFRFLWGNVDETGRHFRRYSRSELIEKVSAAGFDVRFVRFFNYLLFPPIAAVRLVARALPRKAARAGEEVRTDFDLVKSGPLNSLLEAIFTWEASLLALRPPFGVSLLCVATRP